MVFCICGRNLVDEVGDGFIVTNSKQHRWMRRRTDVLSCTACGRRFGIADLRAMVTIPIVRQ